MALIEIDQDELARLQAELNASKPSKTLLDKLGANPKTRSRILGLMKEANPDLAIPEIDAKEEVLSEVRAWRAEMEAEKKAVKEAEALAIKEKADSDARKAIDDGRALLKRRGFQQEGIEKVEDLMRQRNLPDYEAAVLLFEQSQPRDMPIIPANMGRDWQLFAPPKEDNDIKAAVSLPRGRGQENALKRWQWNEINTVLNEIRQGKAA